MQLNQEEKDELVLNAKTKVSDAGFTWGSIGELYNGLQAAVVVSHVLASNAGWWTKPDGAPIDINNPNVFGTKVALIHSEVSEAMEGGRKSLMDDHLPHRKMVEVELADALIRIFDLAGAMNLDLAGAVVEKLAYNLSRADHKPEARYAEGGKKF